MVIETNGLPSFDLRSRDFGPGDALPRWARARRAGGEDRSPELHWSGAPEETRSFAVTCFDPDAPGGSWWHWVVCDLPASTTSLPRNAGDPDAGLLPSGALVLPGEHGVEGYQGAAPPTGHGPHRYVFAVTALDADRAGVGAGANIDALRHAIADHAIGRAQLIGLSETPR